MVAYLFGRPWSVRYGVREMMLNGHSGCGRGGTEPAGAGSRVRFLRRLREGCGGAYVVAIANHRVVPAMTVTAAGFTLLLDVRELAACRELAIAANDAPAGESSEAEKSNETHKTLTRTAIIIRSSEQVLYPGQPVSLAIPSLPIIGGARAD